MIEKDITTWEEFKKALTESITEDTTYYIKNDLDASNDILTESINCITDNRKNKIFKGNDYKINAITAYGDVTVFNSNQNSHYRFRFYNIKFTNFMIDSGTFTNLCRSSKEEGTDLFVNCFFNGICKNFSAYATSNRLSYFTKCSFNVRCTRFSSSNNIFDFCYIIITPLQNTNTFNSEAELKNCYVEGVIKSAFSSGNYLTPRFTLNNVFNCKVIITNYSDSTTYKVYGSNSPVLINKDKLLQSDGVTPITKIETATNVSFLTDEQLKNKEYIQQNTTFPLYG